MPAVGSLTRISLKNILYTTDFSPAAEAALPFAIQLARRFGAKVHALHVRPMDIYAGVPPGSWPVLAEEAERAIRESSDRLEKLLGEVPHNVIIGQGDIWEVLSAVVQENDIDMIVLGTHGRTGVGRLLLGSAAEEILRRAMCPVLTVGPNVCVVPQESVEMHEILYAVDFTPESLAAAPYAVSLAQENQARLTLLHVCKEPKAGELILEEQFVTPTLHMLHGLVPPEAEMWCEPQFLVQKGDVAETILDTASLRRADLIVLGVRGERGVPGAATHLSTPRVHQVLVHAKCPVLTVRG